MQRKLTETNRRLAELHGYRFHGHPDYDERSLGWRYKERFALDPEGRVVDLDSNDIPDYTTDLNAFHALLQQLDQPTVTLYSSKLSGWAGEQVDPDSKTVEQDAQHTAINAPSEARVSALLAAIKEQADKPTL